MTKIFADEASAPDHILLGVATYHVKSDRLISVSGDDILLRWQSAQVLRILSESLGMLVPRDELIDKVWQGVSVTDDSLTQCIADIRRALGDHDHALLKTVRKRGYVLHGEIIASAANSDDVPPDTHSEPMQDGALMEPRSKYSYAPSENTHISAQLDPRDVLPTLAILPMRRLPDGADDPLGILISDEISGALGRSADANIISRLSTANITVSPNDIRQMRRVLNADFVLSGFILNQGDKTVLSVEFADTENQFVLWSDRMTFKRSQMLHDTSWIDRIVVQIRSAIMLNEVRRIQSQPLQNLKLFSILHGAIGLMHRFSPKDFNTAREHMVFVASQVPNSPTPLAWLARWHVLRTVQDWTDDPDREARDALAFTARALDLDPNHTLALVCEGQVLAHLAHRFDEAQERYDIALASNPNDAQGRALRGVLASFQDNGTEGKRDTERALHLTPLDPHRFFYLVLAAAANLSAGDYPRAVTLAKESLRLNRTHISTLRTLVVAQVGSGNVDAARLTASELLRQQPNIRVSTWLRTSPSAGYQTGQRFAEMLRIAGLPD